jgi:DNA modification methylase
MVVKHQKITDNYAIYCGDCCEVLSGFPEESIHFSVFSPPFCSLYSYSDDTKDMGNSSSYQEFFDHFSYLVEILHKIIMKGRIVAVHCMDLPTHKVNGEEIGLRDFPGELIKCFESKGFIYHSRHCIWKDPLVAATRTKAIGLAHKQIIKDSAMCRPGIPDYVLTFRKKGENPEPIQHPQGLSEYHGANKIPRLTTNTDQRKNKLSHWIWQQYASPVWMDIRMTKVLNFKQGKSKEDTRHICPLQRDVIARCLTLWTNEGDKVLTPFMGVASEVYESVRMKRRGIGVELKPSYYKQAMRNLSLLRDSNGLLNGRSITDTRT